MCDQLFCVKHFMSWKWVCWFSKTHQQYHFPKSGSSSDFLELWPRPLGAGLWPRPLGVSLWPRPLSARVVICLFVLMIELSPTIFFFFFTLCSFIPQCFYSRRKQFNSRRVKFNCAFYNPQAEFCFPFWEIKALYGAEPSY